MNNHEQLMSAHESNNETNLDRFPFLDFSRLSNPLASRAARYVLLEQSQYLDSQHLPSNPYPLQENFDAYPTIEEVAQELKDGLFIEKDTTNKVDFIDEHNPNIGWKFHLNIAPDSVVEAADYLARHNYMFKYMGGPYGGHEPGPGKVFTVYVGSHAKALEIADPLAEGISGILRKPEAIDEVEFAPGVIGRFNALDGNFTQYGPSGFVLVQGFVEWLKREGVEAPYSPEIAERMELRSLDILLAKYNKYFIDTAEAVQ